MWDGLNCIQGLYSITKSTYNFSRLLGVLMVDQDDLVALDSGLCLGLGSARYTVLPATKLHSKTFEMWYSLIGRALKYFSKIISPHVAAKALHSLARMVQLFKMLLLLLQNVQPCSHSSI